MSKKLFLIHTIIPQQYLEDYLLIDHEVDQWLDIFLPLYQEEVPAKKEVLSALPKGFGNHFSQLEKCKQKHPAFKEFENYGIVIFNHQHVVSDEEKFNGTMLKKISNFGWIHENRMKLNFYL